MSTDRMRQSWRIGIVRGIGILPGQCPSRTITCAKAGRAREAASSKRESMRPPHRKCRESADPFSYSWGVKYFLAKSEPQVYSIDDLKRDGRTLWDGVVNPQAVRAILSMQPGD